MVFIGAIAVIFVANVTKKGNDDKVSEIQKYGDENKKLLDGMINTAKIVKDNIIKKVESV